MPIRMVIADDHPIINSSLMTIFSNNDNFEVIACCNDGLEAYVEIQNSRPDVAILDSKMPGLNGLDVARKLHESGFTTKIILFTAMLSENEMLEAIKLGIDGVVLKEMSPQLLIQCVLKVYTGEKWMERHMSSILMGRLIKISNNDVANTSLSPREVELIKITASGLRNKAIADKLCISEGTVKVHLYNIYKKLNINGGRIALLRYAQENGLV